MHAAQALNLGIFAAIGHIGVYYGAVLGACSRPVSQGTPMHFFKCLCVAVLLRSLCPPLIAARACTGHKVPWVHGFPFSVVSHPQYVGSVLTLWAVPALLWQQRPVGLLPVSVFWTGLYALTAFQEACF